MQADNIFAKLRRAVSKLDKRAVRHNSWISEDTWRLVNERVSMRREPGQDQRRPRQLGRDIRATLKEDMQRRAKALGYNMERLMTGTPPYPEKHVGG